MADHLTTPTFTAEDYIEFAECAEFQQGGIETSLTRALRFAATLVEENAALRDDLAHNAIVITEHPSVTALRAQLARVQALPGAWRNESNRPGTDNPTASTLDACAAELDAALKGE